MRIIRTADILNFSVKEEKTRISYSIGDARARQSLGVGVSIVLEYTEAAGKQSSEELYLESWKQLEQMMNLIQKYSRQDIVSAL